MATITASKESVRDNIVSAKYVLLGKLPFIGAVIYQVPVICKSTEEMEGEIAYTDGYAIAINEDYFAKHTFEELLAILAHEVGHIVLKSMGRRGSRIHNLWNIATDFVINNMLDTAANGENYLKFPTTDINGEPIKYCLDHKYDNMTAEVVYDILLKEEKQKNQKASESLGGLKTSKALGTSGKASKGEKESNGNSGISKGSRRTKGKNKDSNGSRDTQFGGYQSYDPQTSIESSVLSEKKTWAEVEERINEILSKALITAREYMRNREYGKNAGCFMEEVDISLSQQVDWRKQLQRNVRTLGFDHPDYSRPSRRTLVNFYTKLSRFYFPRQRGSRAGNILVCIDSSGSVNTKSLSTFLGEINNCLRAMPGSSVYLYTCDTELKFIGKYTAKIPEMVPIYGRGGTSFEPVFKEMLRLRKSDTELNTLVYFTDGECIYPEYKNGELPFKTIWCMDNNVVDAAPFGLTVRVSTD